MNKKKLYLAPMEGVTESIVRNAFYKYFPGIDKYFTPFIPAGKSWNKKIKRDLALDNNVGLRVVPQAISNKAEEMFYLEERLMDIGYTEYNLNLGCPSGTVVSKGRGAGFLGMPDELDSFLHEVYANTKMKLSIKTRIGMDDTDEWERLIRIFSKYPMDEIIVHPRLRIDQYKGTPRLDEFQKIVDYFRQHGVLIPIIYNGDIESVSDYENIVAQFPDISGVMIGRGALKRPWIFEEIITGKAPKDLSRKIRGFHDYIYNSFSDVFSGPKDVIMHMKEIWTYLRFSYPDKEREIKKLLKTKEPSEYKILVEKIIGDK